MVGYILLGILILLILLLCFNVNIYADYSDSVSLKLSYLFFRFRIYPKPEKKVKNKRKKIKKEDSKEDKQEKDKDTQKGGIKSTLKNIVEAQGFKGFLSIIYEILKIITHYTGRLLHHIKIKKFDVYMKVSSDNAADTAVNYGKTCSAVYPAIIEISSFFRCKKPKITVDFDYDTGESEVLASVKVSFRVIVIVAIILKMLFKLLPKLLKLRPKRKVVKKHGRR